MEITNNNFLDLAIQKAWQYQLLTYPNPAVGATVVKKNKILSVEAHKEAGTPHAEVLALKEAFLTQYPNSNLKKLTNSFDIHNFLLNNHNNFFQDCEIYVTLEPCNHIGKTPSCANLIKNLKLKSVYIGVLDQNKMASGGKQTLENSGINVKVLDDKKSKELLYPFLQWQKSRFVFFKIAIRADGSCDGGYITTQDSLNWVHNIRTKIDLMVIGGNTVRIDKPTLDSRFSKTKKAPNILIYSNKTDFDKTIPLFSVKNREVFSENNLNLLDNYNFVMVEGGYNLYKVLKDTVDYLVLFVSTKDTQSMINIEKKFDKKIINSFFINKYDQLFFLK